VTTSKLEQAIGLIKTGQKGAAYPLLVEVASEQPQNDVAWLWLAVVLDDPEKQREALEITLQINPNNETAKKGLARLSRFAPPKLPESPKVEEFVANNPVSVQFAPTPFNYPAPKKKTSPFLLVILAGSFAAVMLFYVVFTFSNSGRSGGSTSLPGNTFPSGSSGSSSSERELGTFYLWYADRPLASVPVVSQVHENAQDATRDDMLLWALQGEACLAEPGTLASFASTRAGKTYVTIQEGQCSGVYGWVPNGVFHDRRP
jgi:hypothetical protein